MDVELIIIGLKLTMRNLWPFKSKVNFAITVLGVSGVGIAYSTLAREKVFATSPVVAEGIKIASMNPTVRDLLGTDTLILRESHFLHRLVCQRLPSV